MSRLLKRIAAGAGSRADIRRGRWLCAFGAVSAVSLGAVAAAYAAGRPWLGAGSTLLLFIVAILAGVLLAQAFYVLESYFKQRGRDLAAEAIWSALREGRAPDTPFTLYLRPFASTDAIAETEARFVPVAATGPRMAHLAMAHDRLEFEGQIERALRPFGPMVALGLPLEHEGAGRILVADEEWQDAIEALMDHAALIVLLPSPRSGTLWEVDQLLASDRMSKTIIVDPPNAAENRSDYDPVVEWARIREAFEKRGYTLPEDDPDGQLVYFGAAAAPLRRTRISLDGTGAVRRFASAVRADLAGV